MKTSVKATIAAVALLLIAAIVVVVVVLTNQRPADTADDAQNGAAPASLIAPDTHLLAEGGSVEVVEFYDFECPACGAFYPIVEDIVDTYEGDITYGVRYFPLQGHVNAVPAALAAEAAAQQDRFKEMFDLLFQRQSEWSGAGGETPEVFREYAEELGLDMDAYDAAVADVATADRVAADYDAGVAAGVRGTPSFFVNGEQIELTDFPDLENAIKAALAE